MLTDPNYRRRVHIRTRINNKYGLGILAFDEMVKVQSGRCLICHKKPGEDRRLSIDHCHKTGKVRGLLCNRCNTGLGHFGDDIKLLKSAIKYLKSHQSDETESPLPLLVLPEAGYA